LKCTERVGGHAQSRKPKWLQRRRRNVFPKAVPQMSGHHKKTKMKMGGDFSQERTAGGPITKRGGLSFAKSNRWMVRRKKKEAEKELRACLQRKKKGRGKLRTWENRAKKMLSTNISQTGERGKLGGDHKREEAAAVTGKEGKKNRSCPPRERKENKGKTQTTPNERSGNGPPGQEQNRRKWEKKKIESSIHGTKAVL